VEIWGALPIAVGVLLIVAVDVNAASHSHAVIVLNELDYQSTGAWRVSGCYTANTAARHLIDSDFVQPGSSSICATRSFT